MSGLQPVQAFTNYVIKVSEGNITYSYITKIPSNELTILNMNINGIFTNSVNEFYTIES